MNNFGGLGKDNPLPCPAGRSLRSLTRNLQELNLSSLRFDQCIERKVRLLGTGLAVALTNDPRNRKHFKKCFSNTILNSKGHIHSFRHLNRSQNC